MAKGSKFYVVWEGYETGVYASWAECQLKIKGYPNAKFKSFKTRQEAEKAFLSNPHIHLKKKKAKPSVNTIGESTKVGINWETISVDAACSGNPGIMEYQGVETATGARIFHNKFKLGTNNIGEFLAIVHALARFKKSGENTPIYTDSRTAMSWVRKKKCNTKLERTYHTEELYEVIKRAEIWLHNNAFDNPILKWDTEKWGEIPADFGRK